MFGKPDLTEEASNIASAEGGSSRQPEFSANDYARLLDVIADTRMVNSWQLLIDVCSREQLDCEKQNPWSESFAPHFNDDGFKPQRVKMLRGGVLRSLIESINPTRENHTRNALFIS